MKKSFISKFLGLALGLVLGVGALVGANRVQANAAKAEYSGSSPYSFGTIPSGWSTGGGAMTINGVEWTYDACTYLSLNSKKLQVGSSKNPQTNNWCIETPISSFGADKQITKVTITAYTTAASATYDISVGGTSYKSGSLTTSSASYNTGAIAVSSGSISITLKGSSSSKAMYLADIQVEFGDVTASDDPEITITPDEDNINVVGKTVGFTAQANEFVTNISDFQWSVSPSTGVTFSDSLDDIDYSVASFTLNTAGNYVISATAGGVTGTYNLKVDDRKVQTLNLNLDAEDKLFYTKNLFNFAGTVDAEWNDGEKETGVGYDALTQDNFEFALFSGTSGGTAITSLVPGVTEMTSEMNGKYLSVKYGGAEKRTQITVLDHIVIGEFVKNNFAKSGNLEPQIEDAYLSFTVTLNGITGTPTLDVTSSNTDAVVAQLVSGENKINLTPAGLGTSKIKLTATLLGSTAEKEIEITVSEHVDASEYDFADIEGFSGWDTSYADKTLEYDDATILLNKASKQTTNITNVPVIKGGSFELKAKNNKTIKGATVTFAKWGSKEQTLTLNASTNLGETYTSTGVTSTNFAIEKLDLAKGTNAISVTFSSASNQIGVVSCKIYWAAENPITSLNISGSVSLSNTNANWDLSNLVVSANCQSGDTIEDVKDMCNITINPSTYTVTETKTIKVSVTATLKTNNLVTVTNDNIDAVLTFTKLYSIRDAYTASKGAEVTVIGVYMGSYDTPSNGIFIANGEYGVMIYGTSSVAGYVVGETVLKVTAKTKLYNGLVELTNATITKASAEEKSLYFDAPVDYVFNGSENPTTNRDLASRPTVVEGTVTAKTYSGSLTVTLDVNGSSLSVYAKSGQSNIEELAEACTVGAEVKIKGFLSIFNDFQVVIPELVTLNDDYTAEEFAQELLDATDAVCSVGYNNSAASFTKIFSDLKDKFITLNESEVAKLVGATANYNNASEDVIENAMGRYDWLVKKYSLNNFIERDTSAAPVGPSSRLIFAADSTELAILITVTAVIAATTLLGYILISKKRKENY